MTRPGSQILLVERGPAHVERYGRRVRTVQRSQWARYDPALRAMPLEQFGQLLIELFSELEVWPAPKTPAGLAWKYFRLFIDRPLPHQPEELLLFCARSLDTYVVVPPRASSAYVYMYDKVSAYADYLRRLPNMGRGRFERVDRFASPFGIYALDESATVTRSGFFLAQHEEQAERAGRGWIWSGDWSLPSPFAKFVELCHAYSGPFKKIMRRLPAFVVGKTWRHEEGDVGNWRALPTFYPLIWCNVVGGLEGEMRTLLARENVMHAFVDSVHLTEPMERERIGQEVGQWRLITEGEAQYHGLNHYEIGQVSRHQGIRLEGR